MNLTKNFTLNEMVNSEVGRRLKIANQPNAQQIENLKILCEHLLQPLRDACGQPLSISSGYRCRKLNEAVGGSSSSDHTHGRAVDITTDNPMAILAWVCRLNLSFDQAIIYKRFIHLSYRDKDTNRNQVILKA
ncbi:zinc D-Ala-D-Ala carboxypeptidase [Dysgonomonadaceae bacterium PH5-43]|nr:zinc D-Ala-D-Ala carboxypeptidase [Dysgonomonadaceae bacterium PH5-43]